MAFTSSISIAQSQTGVTITDTSDYTSEGTGTFTSRSVEVKYVDGTHVTGSPFSWPLLDPPLVVAVPEDTALAISADWIKGVPVQGSVYSVDETFAKTYNTELFRYNLLKAQVANPDILSSDIYRQNMSLLDLEIENAKISAKYNDVYLCYQAIYKLTYMIENQSQYF